MSIYDIKVKRINGEVISMEQYKGKFLVSRDGVVLNWFEPYVKPAEINTNISKML